MSLLHGIQDQAPLNDEYYVWVKLFFSMLEHMPSLAITTATATTAPFTIDT